MLPSSHIINPGPSHIPHSSSSAVPPHSPAQSIVSSPQQPSSFKPGPSHIPHSSSSAVPPHSPLQSCTQSFHGKSSQTPHSSSTASPFGTPAQSSHVELSPAHIPHSSISNKQLPSQSKFSSAYIQDPSSCVAKL